MYSYLLSVYIYFYNGYYVDLNSSNFRIKITIFHSKTILSFVFNYLRHQLQVNKSMYNIIILVITNNYYNL